MCSASSPTSDGTITCDVEDTTLSCVQRFSRATATPTTKGVKWPRGAYHFTSLRNITWFRGRGKLGFARVTVTYHHEMRRDGTTSQAPARTTSRKVFFLRQMNKIFRFGTADLAVASKAMRFTAVWAHNTCHRDSRRSARKIARLQIRMRRRRARSTKVTPASRAIFALMRTCAAAVRAILKGIRAWCRIGKDGCLNNGNLNGLRVLKSLAHPRHAQLVLAPVPSKGERGAN